MIGEWHLPSVNPPALLWQRELFSGVSMANNKPTHTAYTVRDFTKSTGEVDARWLEIGVAWLHKDGKGFDVSLEAVPVNGRVVLRLNEPKPRK